HASAMVGSALPGSSQVAAATRNPVESRYTAPSPHLPALDRLAS
ncbi:hypothetical protein A2U01_0111464, partial [Trifolium medium]|nr:hypothetical protein [Trifolium medium]